MQAYTTDKQQKYYEWNVPFEAAPMTMAGLFADSGLSDTYVIYEYKGTWYMGFGAEAWVRAYTSGVKFTMGENEMFFEGDTSTAMAEAVKAIPVQGWMAYGIANYELACHNYGVPFENDNDALIKLFLPCHEVRLMSDSAVLRATDENKLEHLIKIFSKLHDKALLAEGTPFSQRVQEHAFSADNIQVHDAELYKSIVYDAVHEIRDKDYTKVILSRKIPLETKLDMASTYIRGRKSNTPARSYIVQIDGLEAVGFSPETVVESTGTGEVETFPLAGTRLLGNTPEEEKALRDELLTDSKEIHEHAISVKTSCEELKQVCPEESVSVFDFMGISRRGTVQHIGSRVRGKLKPGYSVWHAFNSLFPAVTASGIPKREALESIARHENQPRNLYSGCVVITGSDGFIDAALVLRTIFQKDGKAWLRAGAGIVDMSTPNFELSETCGKLRSVSQYLVSA